MGAWVQRIIMGLAGAAASGLLAAEAAAQSREGFQLGLEGYRYDYEEEFEGARIVDDEGRFFGLTAEYGRAVGRWDLRVAGRAAGGLVDYESNEGDRLNDVAQATVQLELRAGRRAPISPTVTVTPFIGLGVRGHGDASGGLTTNTGLRGYDRYISYAYAPIGASVDFRAGPRTSVTVSAQYNLFLGGESEAEFGDIEPGAPTVVLELEDGSGWALSAEVNRAAGRGTVSFGPFLRTWDVEQSTVEVFEEDGFGIEIFEPDNRTIEAGLKLAYRF